MIGTEVYFGMNVIKVAEKMRFHNWMCVLDDLSILIRPTYSRNFGVQPVADPWGPQGAIAPPKRLTKYFLHLDQYYRLIIWWMFSPKQLESVFKQPKSFCFWGVSQTPYPVSVFSKI